MSGRRIPRLYAVIGRRLTSEEGFTLIEVVTSMGIVLVALLAFAYTTSIGFSDVALARQRQGANSLANQAMEQIRALPFDTMKRGLSNTDLAGDSNITQCGSPPVSCYGGEFLVHGNNPNVVPLVPHIRTLTVGPTTYTVSSYVTYYQNDVSLDTYRVTVIATWPNPARRGVLSRVITQSIFFGGVGCLSTATHPFAGPCQPFLYGNSTVDAGHVDITGTVSGINLEQASLWMPQVTSNMQIEQVSAVQGTAQTGGLSYKLVGLPEETLGRDVIASKADTDPAQSGQTYDDKNIPPPPQVGGTISKSGLGNTLTISAGAGGDKAETTSAAQALSATYACADRTGTKRNDGLPCGNSNARLAPTLSANLSLVSGILNLGSSALVTVDPPAGTLPNRVAFTNRDLTHEAGEPSTECPSTSGDGCVHSDSFRNTGDVKIGGLLSALQILAPLGWQGYLVRVNPATSTVSADVGMGAQPPSATSSGNISYWNGTGYSTIPIASGSPTTVNVGPLNISGGLLLPGVSLVLSAVVAQGANTLNDPAGCVNACTRSTAAASSGSPIVDLTFRVTVSSLTLANLNVHVDLGTAYVQNTYQAAPSGA
ncbi:MAG TPA: type II secretion system protein [Actinomycetota bacterium]|nr:type II secretion system protein [Actinomycetota bacterium]